MQLRFQKANAIVGSNYEQRQTSVANFNMLKRYVYNTSLTILIVGIVLMLPLVLAVKLEPIIVMLAAVMHLMGLIALAVIGHNRLSTRLWFAVFSALIVTIVCTYAGVYWHHGVIINDEVSALSFSDALYHSIVTWTTLGYGDMAPKPDIRLIAAFQAILGYIGLGLLVGELLNVRQNRQNKITSIRGI